MSVFSNWSHTAHKRLASAGFPLPLGQVHQILSAGFGHNSLASFRLEDHDALERAPRGVVDIDKMQRRAEDFNLKVEWYEIFDAIPALHEGSSATPPPYTTLKRFWAHVMDLVTENIKPIEDEIARSLGGKPYQFEVTAAKPFETIEASLTVWKWHATGFVYVECADEYFKVPITAEVAFPKRGRHLMDHGYIARLKQTGEAEPYDEDLPTEFDYQAGND
ncbi:hypothetical protein [Rhodoferax sp.]|uniref:hypothetical protein n=1 Tax=Rhodoferax sp. TaxID=50421 RepID=UPI002733D112|nr:hypothetical protein [Rhodoferax sp.]MDP3190650.1 hypothetical protein [Rhodoferax sp.]